ncbi:MAG TPA: TetR/AcrR family transcriptional regulator [Ktedonobacterales bacterium]|nr:TetR/AcrR family transcriptional regulator [Ktedonobacterales bacterium]
MPYSKAHKERTHAQIVRTAAQAFRREGVHAMAIPRLMGEAGLTHGGFYAHFRNKDALVAEACDTALNDIGQQLIQAVQDAPPDEKVRTVVRWYLSRTHRDRPELGCAIPSLGSEIARESTAVRAAFTAGLERYASQLARALPGPEDGHAHSEDVLQLLSGMAGAVLVSRAVDDPALSDRILRDARDFYMAAFATRLGQPSEPEQPERENDL